MSQNTFKTVFFFISLTLLVLLFPTLPGTSSEPDVQNPDLMEMADPAVIETIEPEQEETVEPEPDQEALNEETEEPEQESVLEAYSPGDSKVTRGERPPINLEKVPIEAMEAGKIYIKFKPQAGMILEAGGIKRSEAGYAITGVEQIDLLNKIYGVTLYESLFYGLYNMKGRSDQFLERHRAWGFHLWYEVSVDHKHDLKKVIEAYNSLNEVETAAPVYKKQLLWTPDDSRFADQWHYHNTGQQSGTAGADIDLVRAWDIVKGNAAVIVAIIDDGIQYDHPDLAANMWSGRGYNFVNNSTTINPGNHGTHVAGTVAAVSHNSTGVAGIAGGSGTGDGIRLMSCQVFDGESAGGFHLAPVYAADNGAAISQNSWGYISPGVYDEPVLDAIDYFNANGGGTVLNGGITIFAAGNDDDNSNWYPGYYSGAMAVAATNNQDQKAWYSNYGTWVEISAPGGETNSVNARGVLSTVTGNGYAYLQGTSMACPHVSGVAALIISKAPNTLTAAEVRDILKDNTDDHYAVNSAFTGQLGTGRLNAYYALQAVVSGIFNPGSFQTTAVSTNQVNLSWVKNTSNDDVMLAWSADGVFGTPGNGTEYSAGESIPGGGTVLYRGIATSYNHTDLNHSTTYYYRAFSYNASNHYSTGSTASANTLSPPISSFPWTETFESDSPTRAGWTQVQVNGTKSWSYATGSSGGSITGANTGFLNARFTSSNTGGTTKLITPPLNLTSVSNPNLSFWYGQQEWFGDQNELKVYYRTNPSASWVQIFRDAQNRSSWTNKTLALPNPSATYQIAFEGTDNWGRANVLDNVTVGAPPPRVVLVSPANNVNPAGTRVVFRWNEADGATKYQLQIRRTGNNSIFRNLTLGNVTQRAIPTFPADGTEYKWRVRAGNDSGWGPFSAFRQFKNPFGAFNHNFNTTNGFYNWIRRPQAVWRLNNNTMVTAGQANRYVSARRGNAYYRNLDYSVRMRRTNSNFGEQYLVIRAGTKYTGQNLWHPGYGFGYRNNGSYRVIILNNDGTITNLRGWTRSNSINQDGWNTLRVVAVGNNLRFFINGTLVYNTNNSAFARGTVGLMMFRRGNDPTSTRLLVDWARLSKP